MTPHVRRRATAALCGAFAAGCLATAAQSVTAGAYAAHPHDERTLRTS